MIPAHILVVDDNPTNLLLLCDLLEFEGHRVAQAVDAAAALEAIAQHRPDLILLDVGLPDLDGLALTRRLKSDAATRDIRIAIVTAGAMKGDEEQAWAAGCDAYISKPIDSSRVVAQVAALLGRAGASAAAESPASGGPPPRRESVPVSLAVLVVDDLAANRLLLREILEPEGYRVLEAADGVDALALLERGDVAAVISDVLMPNMDGFRLCLEIRKHPRYGATPFLIYTSTYDSPADQALALKVGADRYLVKPAPTREILEALAAARAAAANRGPVTVLPPDEVGMIKQYNASLVAKLEDKNAALESTLARLREQETRFRQLAEAIDEVFWLSVPDKSEILYVSPAYEAIWGRPCALLLSDSRAWLDSIHPEDRDRVRAAAVTKQRAGTYDEEYRVVRPDGTLRWIRDRAFPIRNASGEIHRIAGVAADISEQKKARDQIEEQARLLDLTQDSISVRTIANEILYWNRASETLYGWAAAEVHGRPVQEILRPRAEHFEEARRAVMARGEWQGELEVLHRSGRSVIVDSRWTLLRDAGGQPKAVLVISTDITEKKQLVAQFHRAQRLESIGTLASGIAHDLNNILAPVLMSAPMLRWGLPPREVDKMIETIESSARRGAQLVRQLLTFGRGAEGPRAVMRVNTLLREILEIARQTFPKNIDVQARIERDLPPVLADATQLHQVLLNLCVNARDAMPHGGTLTLAARSRRIEEAFTAVTGEVSPGEYLVLDVSDTGTGIAAGIVDKIFDPFFTTKESGKGTGLGLATVLGIAKGHGGFVTLQTVVGKGTTFSVLLPVVAESTPEALAAPAEVTPRGDGQLILVVDDEPGIRATIEGILLQRGYRVITAVDGTDGIAKFIEWQKQIELVITDLDMPGMDGVAMIQVLRRMTPIVAVLVSSGLVSQARMKHRTVELDKLGVHDILNKPYTAQRLFAAVHEALAGSAKRT